MSTVSVLDPKIYEFETGNAADEYAEWLHNEVQKARLSPVIGEDQAMNRLDAHRAKLLERMKNAD